MNDNKNLISKGIDPFFKVEKQKTALTFQEFAETQYLPHAKENKKSWYYDYRTVHNDMMPVFGRYLLSAITKRDTAASGGKETVKAMSKNLFYYELNAKQIYLEIIKRFPAIEYQQDQLSMFDIFGEEWRLLDEDAREQAEVWFRKVITDKYLKGIKYEDVGDGEYLYMRIPNDKYAQDK